MAESQAGTEHQNESGEAANTERPKTPNLMSPPVSNDSTRDKAPDAISSRVVDRNSEPVDSDELKGALHRLEQGNRSSNSTPGASPARKRQRVWGDRSVPSEAWAKPCLMFW